jgi:hypothetical protein
MLYRSDWPEAGSSRAISEGSPSAPDRPDWIEETRFGELILRWLAWQDGFETSLYGLPICSLRLEIEGAGPDLPIRPESGPLLEGVAAGLKRLLSTLAFPQCYLLAKVCRNELTRGVLQKLGFLEVEARRLYRTRIGDLLASKMAREPEISCATLADCPMEKRSRFREQVFDICEETFGRQGYSRHFHDPFLLNRLPGIVYIRAAMQRNFERIGPRSFYLALDTGLDRVCGFSVIVRKSSFEAETYTQLLSAVREQYQNRHVYQGITGLMQEQLPLDAVVVNATHDGNLAMAAAYERSGRVFLATTAGMRFVIGQPDTSL